MKNPITKGNVGIAILAVIIFFAYNSLTDPDFLDLKEPDEISNEELLEKAERVSEKGAGVLSRALAVEGLEISIIIGALIGIGIFVVLELRKKKKS